MPSSNSVLRSIHFSKDLFMKMGENSELSNLKGRFRGRNQSVELAIG